MHPFLLAVSEAQYTNLAQFPAISVNLPTRSSICQILSFRIVKISGVQADSADIPHFIFFKKIFFQFVNTTPVKILIRPVTMYGWKTKISICWELSKTATKTQLNDVDVCRIFTQPSYPSVLCSGTRAFWPVVAIPPVFIPVGFALLLLNKFLINRNQNYPDFNGTSIISTLH